MEIITTRLLLREYVDEDTAAFLAYESDPGMHQFHAPGEAAVTPLPALIPLFVQWAAEVPRRNWQLAIAERVRPAGLVGSVGLRSAGVPAGDAEFGLELAPPYWGRGYATEAARALLAWGFATLPIVAVHGNTISGNTRVGALVHRLGFRPVEERAGSGWLATRGWREVRWELRREDWEAGGAERRPLTPFPPVDRGVEHDARGDRPREEEGP